VECGLIFDRALDGDAFGAPAIQLPQLVDSSGREHPIRPGITVVGREGDIQVADSRVSRRHAQLSSAEGSLTLEDLGSTNGTKVDGTRLTAGEKRPLISGTKVSFGGVEMTVSVPGDKSANATQVFGGNKTAAMTAAPQVETAPATLVGEGKRMPLKPGVNTFGRKTDNDVAIVDPYVSGRHGLIEVAEDGFFLTDTGSTNGTMLNDAKLVPNMRTSITPDDVIRLGSMEFKIEPSKKGSN
jgi:pSer/pThr/pTyr-binding forkhead associated (FHA) protein